jgi:organic hydroperoxide reductase OsmC/OhrA
MRPFPHRYTVTATSGEPGDVELTADGVAPLVSAPPVEFDGPGDRWSPEALLTGAVADCFVLTFRAIARASKLPWTSVRCEATGTLDRTGRVTSFTAFELSADLLVPNGTNVDAARRALEKAEQTCLVTQSLKAAVSLRPQVHTDPATTMVR